MVVCEKEFEATIGMTDPLPALELPAGYTELEDGVKTGALNVDGIADEETELDTGAEPDWNVP